MANRSWRYRSSLIVVTLILLVPQGIGCFWLGSMYWQQMPPLPPIPGVTRDNVSYSHFSYATFWRGKIVQSVPNYDRIRRQRSTGIQIVTDYALQFTDPETDQRIGNTIELPDGYHRPVVVDDRLFLIGLPDAVHPTPQTYEFIDSELQPIDFAWAAYDSLLLIDGKLSRIGFSSKNPALGVSTFEAGAWTGQRQIVLPEFEGNLMPESAPTDLPTPISIITPISTEMSIYSDGPRLHLFLPRDGKLYHKVGLTLRSIADPSQMTTYGADPSTPAGDPESMAGWTQVVDETKALPWTQQALGAVFDGKPIALLVEAAESLHPVGHYFEFDGSHWKQRATIPFPFGSKVFRLIVPGEKKPPYVVATSSTGTGFAYQWDNDGFREIAGQGPALTWFHVQRNWIFFCVTHGIVLALGLLPLLGLWPIIDLWGPSQYVFGNQTAKLAPIGYRAMARLIDLSLVAIVGSTIAVSVLQRVNWYEVAESLQLKVDHPDFLTLHQAAAVVEATVALMAIALIFLQGVWGVTPGKWICGIRTVQTSLRRCGLARSITREALLFLDSAYLLWWVPGTLTAGLTEKRQRLGDLVGGTIVIRSRSLKSIDHEIDFSERSGHEIETA